MINQEAIDEINKILDRVYSLEVMPVEGINQISKIVSDITAD